MQDLKGLQDRQVSSSSVERWVGRRAVLAGTIAASIALVVSSGAIWQANSYEAAYVTAIGETKVIPLPDGSSITMNTDTAAVVHRGEALFDVAKNKMRPFVVTAGKAQVRAVGTSFAVTDLTTRPLEVTVREGVVEVIATPHSDPVAVHAGARAIGRSDGRER